VTAPSCGARTQRALEPTPSPGVSPLSMMIPCPRCGARPYTEFTFGGELRDLDATDADADYRRVFLRENVAGVQAERWFHARGCARWVTVRRDTVANRIVP
jgi:heterotetrameric sarcosine oxidase delta subunit